MGCKNDVHLSSILWRLLENVTRCTEAVLAASVGLAAYQDMLCWGFPLICHSPNTDSTVKSFSLHLPAC